MPTWSKKVAAFLFLGSCFSNSVAIDLMEAYRLAIQNDYAYIIAQQETKLRHQSRLQAKARLRSQANLNYQASYNLTHYYLMSSDSNHSAYLAQSGVVNLNRPLINRPGEVAYQRSRIQQDISELKTLSAEQDLLLRVAQAYFDVIIAEASLEAIKMQKTAIQEQLDIVSSRYELGSSTRIEVYETQSQYDLIVASEETAYNDYQLDKLKLEALTNQPVKHLKKLPRALKLSPPIPSDPKIWSDLAAQNALEVRIQRHNLADAAKNTLQIKYERKPKINMVASHTVNAQSSTPQGLTNDSNGNIQNNTVFGIQLSMPLFTSGVQEAAEKGARIFQQKIQTELEEAQKDARIFAQQNYMLVTSGLAQINALKKALESNTEALYATKIGYEVGTRINLDILNAASQLTQTRLDITLAQVDSIIAQLRLKAIAGELKESDLESLSTVLTYTEDPKIHNHHSPTIRPIQPAQELGGGHYTQPLENLSQQPVSPSAHVH